MMGAQAVVVDAVDDGRVGAFGWCRDNHLARASTQMSCGFVAVGEQSGAFKDDVDLQVFPGQLGGVAYGAHGDTVAIDGQAVGIGLDLAVKNPVYAVVFEQVRVDRAVAEVVDRHDLQLLTVGPGVQRAQSIAANTSETIDGNSQSHR